MKEIPAKSGPGLAPCSSQARRDGICHTCLFYSEAELGERVLPMLQDTVRNFRRVHEFNLFLWPCDVLQRPAMAARATECAEQADVVAVAVDGDTPLCEDLLRWFELWDEHRRGDPQRLIALFHPCAAERLHRLPAFRDLSAYAVRTGVGLIWCGMPDGTGDPAARMLHASAG